MRTPIGPWQIIEYTNHAAHPISFMSIYRRLITLLGVAGVSVTSLVRAEREAQPSDQRIGFEFALYFAPSPKTDPEQALKILLEGDFASPMQSITVRQKWSDIADYAPPSPEAFRYVAVDLEMSQGAALAQAERVFILGFEAPPSDLMHANREANTLVYRLAELTDGFPWDAECRLLYSRAAWQERRVASWQGDIPDVRGHVNMHAYRNPDLVRIITLGMRKFGLPDLVIAQTPSGGSRAAGNAINACAQRMLEGQAFDGPRFDLVLADIRHDGMRETALANPLDGATGRARLHLAEAPWEQGDPQNRLLALEFPDGEGQTPLERQASALAALYGSEGSIVGRRPGDEALKAASEKARAAFLAKAPTFRKGLQPNERLVIKAPFSFDDQTEYMWVEVVGWRTSSIEGILMNDSHFNRKLRVGHRVTVNLRDVYDYIHYKPDGTEDGNETGKVLRGP